MKKYLLGLVCIFIGTLGQAKNTYVPFYKTQMSLTQEGKTTALESVSKEACLGTLGEEIVFTVLHEEVTPSKVKSIKRAKANVGWSAFAAGLLEGDGTTEALSSSYIVESARMHAEQVKSLWIDLLVENNTDEDLFLCNLKKGMEYYHIPAHSFMTLSLAQQEKYQFRVSNAYPFDQVERPSGWKQQVAYLSVSAQSHVEKRDVEYEDDSCIILPDGDSISKNGQVVTSFVYIDKETYEPKPMGLYDYRKFRKEQEMK